MDKRMENYNTRINFVLEQAEPLQAALLSELFHELQRLTEENNRLRKLLVKSTQKAGSMSSRLKDALYE